MPNLKPISRRNVLRATIAAIFGMVPLSLFAANRPSTELTPAQSEGPFYPEREQSDKDVDLTLIRGRSQRAAGEIIEVSGQIYNRQGQPVANALVEIWQANKWGRYSHSKDPNTAPLDENFQGWGQARTDQKGFYRFKTIMPGSYPASPIWTRPPHIHFKVWVSDVVVLTTQMYFAGNKLNADDQILNNLSFDERNKLIVKPLNSAGKAGSMIQKYQFDLLIQPTSIA